MEQMTQSHFLDKYNNLLILLKTNEDEEEQENKNSQSDYFRRANDFNFDILKRKKNSKNFHLDFSIENININNVRDLIRNKIEFNKNIFDDFKNENNQSEILLNIDKLSYNNEDISMDAGDLLNEINFTESAASSYREKIDRKIGSIIKPTNTFNNRVANDIEYQLDLEKAKRKQRNRENNFNNVLSNRKLSVNNFANGNLDNKNFNNSNFVNKFYSNNLINNISSIQKKETLLSNSKNTDNYRNINLNLKLADEGKINEGLNKMKSLKIEDLKIINSDLNNIEENNQFNNIEIEAEYAKGPNNININFTNYGVMNNNLINYNLPKMNSLNSKMLDLFKEINSNKPKPSYNSSYNINNLNLQSNKYNSNDLNKNKIIESFNNYNLNNLQGSSNMNFINLNNNINNNINNIKEFNNNNLLGSNNLLNSASKEDYFSEFFKSLESKNTIKSLTERINQLKKKNNFTESNIKGVNITNNLLNLNSKYSNLDKIFDNNSNLNIMNPMNFNNKINSFNNKINQNNKIPLFSKQLTRSGNHLFEQGQTNQNNFDLLEAQLDSLKKKTTKTKLSIDKLNSFIIADSSNLNNFKNLDDKINKINYDKLNQSIEECENLINDL